MIDTHNLPDVVYVVGVERLRAGKAIMRVTPTGELIHSGIGDSRKPWAIYGKGGHIYPLSECFNTEQEAAREGLRLLAWITAAAKQDHAKRMARYAQAEAALVPIVRATE